MSIVEESQPDLLASNDGYNTGKGYTLKRAKSLAELQPKIQYKSVDQLFGKILGIERVLLCDHSDTLLQTIEKINLVPEHKLVVVEPSAVEYKDGFVWKPQVKNVITLSDVFNVL
jgi:hypothetical protein